MTTPVNSIACQACGHPSHHGRTCNAAVSESGGWDGTSVCGCGSTSGCGSPTAVEPPSITAAKIETLEGCAAAVRGGFIAQWVEDQLRELRSGSASMSTPVPEPVDCFTWAKRMAVIFTEATALATDEAYLQRLHIAVFEAGRQAEANDSWPSPKVHVAANIPDNNPAPSHCSFCDRQSPQYAMVVRSPEDMPYVGICDLCVTTASAATEDARFEKDVREIINRVCQEAGAVPVQPANPVTSTRPSAPPRCPACGHVDHIGRRCGGSGGDCICRR